MKFEPMLGENLSSFPTDDILEGKLWRVSEKIDGVRRMFHKNEQGVVTAYSRSGLQDIWLEHICKFIAQDHFPSNRVYDCELVDRQLYSAGVQSFAVRRVTTAKASQQYPDNKEDLMALCFDIFKPGGDMTIAWLRDIELYSVFNREVPDLDPIIRVPILGNILNNDNLAIQEMMGNVVAANGEGLMLLDMDSVYIPGRSKSLIKVKRSQDFIGKVIAIEEGRPGSKIEGMVATVICEVEGCTVPVRVGSGFDNMERIDMAVNSPIGEFIEIEAFSYSRNKHGEVSLNLPILKRFVGTSQ